MADVENQQDSSFPVKRKSDIYCQDQDNVGNKAQKLHASSNSAESESKDGEINGSDLANLNSSTAGKIEEESSNFMEKVAGSATERDENGVSNDLRADEKHEGGDEDDNDDDDDDDDDEEEEEEEEEEELARKGKGISRADKGKGKLIEEDDSDDEDDSDEDDEENESDLSDDPLAEVDLDNILPSRTRRRSMQPGLYISNETSKRVDEEDDDSSDDSDA